MKAIHTTRMVPLAALALALATYPGIAQDDDMAGPADSTAGFYEAQAEAESEDAEQEGQDDVDLSLGAAAADDEIEFSISEIQQLMRQGTTKEYQDDPNDYKVLFETAEEFKETIGVDTAPEFIYFPVGVDPMIIPWVRNRVIAEELFQEALIARRNRDFDKAKAILREIGDKYPETEEGTKAPGQIAQIDAIIAQEEAERLAALQAQRAAEAEPEPEPDPVVVEPPKPKRPELPPKVAQTTTAILITDAGEAVALVGDEFLRKGDPVPEYSAVRVKDITASRVVYTYQNEDFPVTVEGTF